MAEISSEDSNRIDQSITEGDHQKDANTTNEVSVIDEQDPKLLVTCPEETTQIARGVFTGQDEAEKPPPDTGTDYSSFLKWEKIFIVLTATFAALFSPLTAQIYFPALTAIANDLHVSNNKVNLTVTTYMVCLSLRVV